MPWNVYISPQLRYIFPSGKSYDSSKQTLPIYNTAGMPTGTQEVEEARVTQIEMDKIGYGLTIGKEWFVGAEYGLGFAISYTQDFGREKKERQIRFRENDALVISEKVEETHYYSMIGIFLSGTFN